MPRPYITNHVKAKIDRTAYAIALMEIGRYEWPDGKQRYRKDEDGIRTYRVVKAEAQRYGWGYDDINKISKVTSHDLFHPEGRYYKLLGERLVYHRRRLAEGYTAELAKLTDDGNALTRLSEKLYTSLMDDLCDPDRAKNISFRDRALLYKEVTKLEAQVKGDAATAPPQPVIKATNVIGTLNLPDTVKSQVMEKLDDIEGEALECTEE